MRLVLDVASRIFRRSNFIVEAIFPEKFANECRRGRWGILLRIGFINSAIQQYPAKTILSIRNAPDRTIDNTAQQNFSEVIFILIIDIYSNVVKKYRKLQ